MSDQSNDALKQAFPFIGDVRGKGLYQMLDIVADRDSKTPDPAMAERIRYNAMLEGAAFIAVKNFIRVCPPLIIAEAELDDAIDRLERALKLAQEGHPRDVDFTSSSSLAAVAR